MITTNDLQRLYVDMYKQIREYLWPFRIVEALADLEIACYKAFPDIDEVKKCFRRLSSEIKFQADKENDEELLFVRRLCDRADLRKWIDGLKSCNLCRA